MLSGPQAPHAARSAGKKSELDLHLPSLQAPAIPCRYVPSSTSAARTDDVPPPRRRRSRGVEFYWDSDRAGQVPFQFPQPHQCTTSWGVWQKKAAPDPDPARAVPVGQSRLSPSQPPGLIRGGSSYHVLLCQPFSRTRLRYKGAAPTSFAPVTSSPRRQNGVLAKKAAEEE